MGRDAHLERPVIRLSLCPPVDAQQLGLRPAHAQNERVALDVDAEVVVRDTAAQGRDAGLPARPQALDGLGGIHLARS